MATSARMLAANRVYAGYTGHNRRPARARARPPRATGAPRGRHGGGLTGAPETGSISLMSLTTCDVVARSNRPSWSDLETVDWRLIEDSDRSTREITQVLTVRAYLAVTQPSVFRALP